MLMQISKGELSALSMLLVHLDMQYQVGCPLEYGIKL